MVYVNPPADELTSSTWDVRSDNPVMSVPPVVPPLELTLITSPAWNPVAVLEPLNPALISKEP